MNAPLIKQGWIRALLFAVVIAAILITIKNYPVIVASVLLVTFLFRKFVDGKSFKSLGFTWRGYATEISLGFLTAIAILGLGTLSLVSIGYLSFTGSTFNNEIVQVISFLIAVAFIEELLFRGYLLNNLMHSFNKWISLSITALLFSCAHIDNPGVGILPVLNVFAAGCLLGINYIYTKNLWFSIFFHFAWNFFQGPILGYQVSGIELTSLIEQNLDGPPLITGGSFGFEGSIICLVLIIIFTFWLSFTYSRRYMISHQHY